MRGSEGDKEKTIPVALTQVVGLLLVDKMDELGAGAAEPGAARRANIVGQETILSPY